MIRVSRNELSPCRRDLTQHLAGDPFSLPYILEFRPAAEFAYESGKSKIANLRIGDEDGTQISFVVPGSFDDSFDEFDHSQEHSISGQQTQLMRLSGWVNVESRLTVIGIGM